MLQMGIQYFQSRFDANKVIRSITDDLSDSDIEKLERNRRILG